MLSPMPAGLPDRASQGKRRTGLKAPRICQRAHVVYAGLRVGVVISTQPAAARQRKAARVPILGAPPPHPLNFGLQGDEHDGGAGQCHTGALHLARLLVQQHDGQNHCHRRVERGQHASQ